MKRGNPSQRLLTPVRRERGEEAEQQARAEKGGRKAGTAGACAQRGPARSRSRAGSALADPAAARRRRRRRGGIGGAVGWEGDQGAAGVAGDSICGVVVLW